MSYFNECFELLMKHEGGYSKNPNDNGGETMYGVTKATARRFDYKGEMRNFQLSMAKDICRTLYWDDNYNLISFILAFDLLDAGYNSGKGRAIKWLQEAVGVKQDRDFEPKTLAATLSTQAWQASKRFNGIRLEYLTNIVDWPHFGKGWARRVAANLKR